MSGWRRTLMMQAAQRQYIFMELKTGTTYFRLQIMYDNEMSFSYKESGRDFDIINDGENNPYVIWYIPTGRKLKRLGLDYIITNSNLIGVRFSNNFDFSGVTSWYYTFFAETVSDASIKYIENIQFHPNCPNFSYMFRCGGSVLERITFKSGVANTTANAITIDRMFHQCYKNIFNGDLSWLSVKHGCNTTYWNTTASFLPQNAQGRYITAIGDLEGSISFGYHALDLPSAIIILQHLQDVTSYGGATLTFSSTTKGYINNDATALALVANAVNNLGWNIALT